MTEERDCQEETRRICQECWGGTLPGADACPDDIDVLRPCPLLARHMGDPAARERLLLAFGPRRRRSGPPGEAQVIPFRRKGEHDER